MAKNQIKIWSDSTRNCIDYYWYGDNGEWSNMAEHDDSPLNTDYYIFTSISHTAYDIYRVLTESYYNPVEGLKIIFVGTDADFDIMLALKGKDFAEYDIEIERGTIDKIVLEEKQNHTQKYSYENLHNLQAILERHGIKNNIVDYKKLTEEYGFIIPKTYLGSDSSHSVYFTTAGFYVEVAAKSWVEMRYNELCPEQMLIDTSDEAGAELIVTDINGNSFRYQGSQEACNNFMKLLCELNDAKISEYDEYYPIWRDGYWSCDETYLYGEILVDFLKLSEHSAIASLIKCGEFVERIEDSDELFYRICEYAMTSEKVTSDALKVKVLDWKNALESQIQELYMAILFKDLVEVLQLAIEEKSIMTSVEKFFLDWLANEAGIEDVERFKEMVMFPYYLVTWKHEEAYLQRILKIEKYASEQQLYIPYGILDNEKIGFWSSLHAVTKCPEGIEGLLNECICVLCCELMIIISCFIRRIISLDYTLLHEQVGAFLGSNELLIEIKEFVEEVWDNEEWLIMCEKYREVDRRHVGAEVVEWWLTNTSNE